MLRGKARAVGRVTSSRAAVERIARDRGAGRHFTAAGRLRKRFAAICLALIIAAAGGLSTAGLAGCRAIKAEKPVLEVGSQEIYAPQARLYLLLCLEAYESEAGASIWQMKVGGRDAYDAACEAAYASMLRSRTVLEQMRSAQKALTDDDNARIAEAFTALQEKVGTEKLAAYGITDELALQYLQEDYLVARFIAQMSYIPDPEEVERQLAETFVWYENLDVADYMQRIQMDAVFLYSGQFLDGEWIPYSQEMQKIQMQKAQEAYEKLMLGESFEDVRAEYSELSMVGEKAPCFTAGLIQCGGRNLYYKGQLERDLWESVFRVPAGQFSRVLETDTGYVIVQAISYPAATDSDLQAYAGKLDAIREEYRERITRELAAQGIEDLIRDWQQEETVQLDEDAWRQITEQMMGEIR